MTDGLTDTSRELIDQLATDIAGDDDAAYLQTMVALLNVAGDIAAAADGERSSAALQQLMRPHPARRAAKRASARRRGLTSAPPLAPAAIEDTIYTDPVFLANQRALVRHRRRIINGQPTSDFNDCVAVGSSSGWCCTGTLVAPDLVVTAAHCARGACAARIMVGTSTQTPGYIAPVAQVHVHPDYAEGGPNDVAALVLAEDVPDVAPRAIAPGPAVDAARSVRLVGFGNTDVWGSSGYGTKRQVDVAMASSHPRFGADPRLEFVAGSPILDRDSCTGDSGGPAYVNLGSTWALAGATSRATASSIRPCGDGGIYGRVSAFVDWLRAIPSSHTVKMESVNPLDEERGVR